MAHRLIASMRKVDWILKNGHLTGNFNIIAQARSSQDNAEFKFLSYSSAYLPQEPWKTVGETLRPKTGNNRGGSKTEEKETAEKKEDDKRTTNAFTTSTALKAPDQGSMFGGNAGGGEDRKKNNRGPVLDEEDMNQQVVYVSFMATILVGMFLGNWSFDPQKSYNKEMIRKDFLANYLGKGRVLEVEVKKAKFVQVSIEFAMSLRLIIDILGSRKNPAPVTRSLEIKVEHKNEVPLIGKNKTRK